MNLNIEDQLQVLVGDGKNTGFWTDRWILREPLRDRFPDLFRLAADKKGCVASYVCDSEGSQHWGWAWSRDPQSQSEWEQVSSLMGMLQQFKIKTGKDKWTWANDLGVDFSVKSIRMKILSQGAQANSSLQFHWNAWATSKSEFLTWRAAMGGLPTQVELCIRGVERILCLREIEYRSPRTDFNAIFSKWWNSIKSKSYGSCIF